jgi:hypothetical protein
VKALGKSQGDFGPPQGPNDDIVELEMAQIASGVSLGVLHPKLAMELTAATPVVDPLKGLHPRKWWGVRGPISEDHRDPFKIAHSASPTIPVPAIRGALGCHGPLEFLS